MLVLAIKPRRRKAGLQMSDKTKAALPTWLPRTLMFGSLIMGFILRFSIGPGLLPFIVAAIGAAIGLRLLTPNLQITQEIRKKSPAGILMIFQVIAFASSVAVLYSTLALGNHEPFFPFYAITFACVGVIFAFMIMKMRTANQKAAQYIQQQRNQKQLDTTKVDPLYAEQPRPDQVKKQR